MKVTDVRHYAVDAGGNKNWVFVKVETDTGIHGWGEAYTFVERHKSIQLYVEALARHLEGRNPLHIKNFLVSAYVDFGGRRPSMDLLSARSAVEQALWDIAGKSFDQPVYNLLGGPVRESVRVYANGWSGGAKSPSDLARQAEETLKLGFDALKFDPFPALWRDSLSPEEESLAVARVAAVREAVGARTDILIEAHRRFDPMTATRMEAKLSKYDPFWYEEPVDVENLSALVEVRNASSTPIVTGETLYTKDEFVPVLMSRAADILNPDVGACGIVELLEIGSMADAHRVRMAPHDFNSVTLGLASTIQVAACLPNFLIAEYFVNAVEGSDAISLGRFPVKDGRIALPQGAGLGIDLDEDAVRARTATEARGRLMPPVYISD